jgi:hypothetical protein
MVLLNLAGVANAQIPPPAPGGPLDQLLAPIALYPDPLIAQILPAATVPNQIAVAYGYVTQGGDPNAIDQQNWDSSVKALARYPDVLKLLSDNLAWTAQLGQAFLAEPSVVMDTIQSLRAQAQAMGNLESSSQMTVYDDDGQIYLEPTDPDLFYVPIYDPGIIFYQRPYGRRFLTFGVGFRLGIWFNHDFDWHNHRVVVWGRNNPRPANYWHTRPVDRRSYFSKANPWRPPAQRGTPRPGYVNRGGDRGYAPRPPQRVTPPREVRPPARPEPRPNPPVHIQPARPQPTRPEPVRQEPAHVAPAPRPAPVQAPHNAPSAFNGVQGGGHSTEAASSRGNASRGGGAPSGGGASHPSGGGGGGKKR